MFPPRIAAGGTKTIITTTSVPSVRWWRICSSAFLAPFGTNFRNRFTFSRNCHGWGRIGNKQHFVKSTREWEKCNRIEISERRMTFLVVFTNYATHGTVSSHCRSRSVFDCKWIIIKRAKTSSGKRTERNRRWLTVYVFPLFLLWKSRKGRGKERGTEAMRKKNKLTVDSCHACRVQ